LNEQKKNELKNKVFFCNFFSWQFPSQTRLFKRYFCSSFFHFFLHNFIKMQIEINSVLCFLFNVRMDSIDWNLFEIYFSGINLEGSWEVLDWKKEKLSEIAFRKAFRNSLQRSFQKWSSEKLSEIVFRKAFRKRLQRSFQK
jgi:hypothetical protein